MRRRGPRPWRRCMKHSCKAGMGTRLERSREEETKGPGGGARGTCCGQGSRWLNDPSLGHMLQPAYRTPDALPGTLPANCCATWPTYLVVVHKRIALEQLVELGQRAVEQVADGGVVGQHQAADTVRRPHVRALARQCHLRLGRGKRQICTLAATARTGS